MAEKLAPEKRHIFSHNGQTVFEWDQTLEEVNMYIKLPLNVHPKQFYCKIQSKHVEVGIRGNPPYLNHDLTSPVKTDCSFWTLEDDIMHITLQKRDKGQTWPSPIQGQGQLDPFASDMEQKRLMLQRFQEEVGIAGVPADTVMKKTKKIEDDWTPVWDQECSLPLTVPEPSIRFRAKVHQFVFGVLSTVLSSLE